MKDFKKTKEYIDTLTKKFTEAQEWFDRGEITEQEYKDLRRTYIRRMALAKKNYF